MRDPSSTVLEDAAASSDAPPAVGSFLRTFSERVPDKNVWRIYGTTFALGTAYGIAISVIAIFLDTHGFAKASIGWLAAAFASGIVVFSLPMDGLIRRFSAKRTLAASLAGYAIAVTAFPYLRSLWAIAIVRFFDGACSVGVWVSSESILLSRADRKNKAFLTSIYAIAIACGYVAGPVAARLCTAFLPLELAFIVAGVIALAAAAYVLWRLDPDKLVAAPEPELAPLSGVRTTLGPSLLARIKTSCFGTFAYGYFQASVVLFLPLYLMEQKSVTQPQTIVIPAYFAGGMLLFSNVAGRLGDRYGHLRLMRLLGVLGMTMVLGFVWLDWYPLMCAAVFVAGATLASISPLSLALQGVVAEPHEYSRATSLYNAFYAAGMLLGPPISSALFAARGGGAMLVHLAALWAAFVAFAWFYRGDDPAFRLAAGAK